MTERRILTINNEILSILRGVFVSNAYSFYEDEKEQRRAYRAAFSAAKSIDEICGLRKYALAKKANDGLSVSQSPANEPASPLPGPDAVSIEKRIRKLKALLDIQPSAPDDLIAVVAHETIAGLLHIACQSAIVGSDDKGAPCLSPAASAITTKALILASAFLGIGVAADEFKNLKEPVISVKIIRN